MLPCLLLIAYVQLAWADPPPDAVCTMVVRINTGSPRIDVVRTSTGVRTTVLESVDVSFPSLGGLVRDGATLLTCADGMLQSVSTTDGVVTDTGVSCSVVAGGDDGVLVAGNTNVVGRLYLDPATLLADGEPDATPIVGLASAAAVHDGEALTVAHARTMIRHWNLAEGSLDSSVTVEVNPPIWGLSVLDGVLYVLDDNRGSDEQRRTQTISAFEPDTGTLLGSVDVPLDEGELARGLLCESAP